MKRLSALLLVLPLLYACSGGEEQAAQRPQRAVPAVELSEVLYQPVGQQISRTATLRAWREVRLSSEEEGRLEYLPHYPGDLVAQGEELLRLDQSMLGAQLSKARAQREQAELDLRRLDRLQANRLVAEDELARARTVLQVAQAEEALLRTRLSNTRLHAPFAGVITARLAEPGDVLGRFSHVLTLSDLSLLRAELSLSEGILPSLSIGDEVALRLDSGEAFSAEILRIHPTVDALSRQGMVELKIASPSPQLRPGQLVRVELQLRPMPRTIIPYAALRRDIEGEYVFMVDEERTIHRVAVSSGIQLGEWVAITDGLSAGQKVVQSGFLGLSEGMTVRLPNRDGQRSAP